MKAIVWWRSRFASRLQIQYRPRLGRLQLLLETKKEQEEDLTRVEMTARMVTLPYRSERSESQA